MSIIDNLLGGSNGGLLSGLLGGDSESTNVNSNSSMSEREFASEPSLGLNLSDVLRSEDFSRDGDDGDVEYSSFTGIGDLGLDIDSPIYFRDSNSQETFSGSQNETDGGGLLSGIF